jgi:4-amino-4-deoxy-L-arabinose transferase-like glycosyltransferase
MSVDKVTSAAPLNTDLVESRVGITQYAHSLARAQDLVAPLLGMYLGQFLLLALPHSPLWGWIAILSSVALLMRRLRSGGSSWMANVVQIALGIFIELPLALNIDLWKNTTPWWQLIAVWLASCVMVGVAAVRQPMRELKLGLPPLQKLDRIDLVVVTALLAAALCVRVPNLETLPRMVNVDEPTMARQAIESVTGGANDPFTVGWATHPTLQFFVHGVLIQALGRTFFAMRLPSAIVGSLAVLALYLLARTGFGRRTAIIAGCLAVASDTAIHFSRLGVNNVTDILFFALVMGLLWMAGASGKPVFFVLPGAVLGLALYYYFGNRAIPFVVVANLFVWVLADWRGVRRAWHLILTMILMSIVVALPLLGYWLSHPSSFTDHLTLTVPFSSQLQQEMAQQHISFAVAFARRILDSVLVFTNTPDRGGFYNPGQSLLHPAMAPFFIIGVIALIANWRPIAQGVLAWIAVSLTLGSVLITLVASFHRLLGVLPAGILVVAIGIDTASNVLARYNGWSQKAAVRLAVGVLVILAVIDLQYYFGVYSMHPPEQAPDEQAYNIASLEYEHLGGKGQFVLDESPAPNEFGVSYSQPVGYVAGKAFRDATPQVLDSLSSSEPIYFYVLANKISDLPEIVGRFPGGSIKEYRRESDGLIFMTRYVVPSAAPLPN